MKILKIFLYILFFLSITFNIGSKDKDNAGPKITDLTIFFTNDTNGHPISFKYMGEDGQGGIPARASLIEQLSTGKNKKDILILDAGGIILGRPESNLFKGIPDIEGMNSIGYFASAVGVSELHESSKSFINLNSKADFYFLCSNIKSKKNELLCDEFIITKTGSGLKVGIFSLISEDAVKEVSDKTRAEIDFLDPIETAKKMVTKLRSKKYKADIVIALTHLGYYNDDSIVGSRTLASEVDGIDLIIDGRTGLNLEDVTINNTKICQVLKWGLYLGELNITLADKKITDIQQKLHPVNYKEGGKLVGELIEEDPKVLRVVNSKIGSLDRIREKPIVKLEKGNFDTLGVAFKEKEIGNLICDAMLDFTKADVAFQNAGGIGKDVIEPSKLTRKSFDKIIKYDNTIVVLDMKGDEIIDALEYSVSKIGLGGFLQVGGITFTYSKSKGSLSDVKINKKPIQGSNSYKVAINSWMAEGGDGFTIFKEISGKINTHFMHREVVYDYLAKIKKIEPYLDGRINIVE